MGSLLCGGQSLIGRSYGILQCDACLHAGGRCSITIILTEEQAQKVRGISPNVSFAALEPVLLKDGTLMLPPEVLTDAAHADVKAFLETMPTKEVKISDRYGEGDTIPAMLSWKDAGVTKP